MTRNQFLGLTATAGALAVVGCHLTKPKQKPAPRPALVQRSDTPQRTSDTPQRVSDTPQRTSDTPQRTAAAPAPKAFSCSDARTAAARSTGVRLRGGQLWPTPAGASAAIFDDKSGDAVGFAVPGGVVLDLWQNKAGTMPRSSLPRRVAPASLPVVALSSLGDAALERALRSAYAPALRAKGPVPPAPSDLALEKPDLLPGDGPGLSARRGATACVFAAPGRRDLVLARPDGSVSAWPSMTEALYGQAADVLGFPR